jgi:hypothetical protein
METMIGHPTDRLIHRFDHLMADLGPGANHRIRPTSLTSRDIEAEVLVRLALSGHDWSGTLGRRRRAP